MIRYQIRFFGIVQQVGFRHYSQQYAKENQCTGWVKNCNDGSVLMEIQGREENINQVITALKSLNHVHIETIKKTELSLQDENSFDYRFD